MASRAHHVKLSVPPDTWSLKVLDTRARCDRHPLILPNRAMREFFQTMISTRLLLHSLILETEVVLSGWSSLMERPREHADADRVSVWRLALHRQWMLRFPDAFGHQFGQWQFGSAGVNLQPCVP